MAQSDMNDRAIHPAPTETASERDTIDLTAELPGAQTATRGAVEAALRMHTGGMLSDAELSDALAEIARDPQGASQHLFRVETDQAMEPLWLSNGCPSWCVEKHHERDHREDRFHVSVMTDRFLTLHDPVEMSDGARDWWEPERVRLYLRQHVTDAEPTVCMFRGDTADGVEMMLEEARAVAERLADLVRQGAGPSRANSARPAAPAQSGVEVCDRPWCELAGRPIGEEPSRVLGEWNPLGLHEEHRRTLGTVRVAEGTHEHDPVTVTVQVTAWRGEPARIELRHDVDGRPAHDDAGVFLGHDEAARLVDVLSEAVRRADR
jgi:hypothetical protein